ncbi:hypothetical protein SLEP1_g49828 [Rubroshorea leprosula]|uniref:Uncharacterized protein n=1 Tax=Rubroshorea leprosula TaxID=152421 RepID=A0AAV5LYU5_9ROSI|nr:hypothetical protein SLEP1_g49828 [Rubroshorea leprosula]
MRQSSSTSHSPHHQPRHQPATATSSILPRHLCHPDSALLHLLPAAAKKEREKREADSLP